MTFYCCMYLLYIFAALSSTYTFYLSPSLLPLPPAFFSPILKILVPDIPNFSAGNKVTTFNTEQSKECDKGHVHLTVHIILTVIIITTIVSLSPFPVGLSFLKA